MHRIKKILHSQILNRAQGKRRAQTLNKENLRRHLGRKISLHEGFSIWIKKKMN
jgi:hypothetical protein